MKLEELTRVVLEGQQAIIYEELLPLLIIETADGVVAGDVQPGGEISTSPGAGWGPGPLTGGAHNWLNQFYASVKSLAVAKRMLKRMKDIGIDDSGQKRVQQAAKNAAKNVNSLLSNPRAVAYRVPTWTFDKPKTPIIRRWNEGFAYEFKKELSTLVELREIR